MKFTIDGFITKDIEDLAKATECEDEAYGAHCKTWLRNFIKMKIVNYRNDEAIKALGEPTSPDISVV